MAGSYSKLIAQNIFKIIRNPFTAAKFAWRRLFPYGIVPKDPEAYRIGSWSYGNLPRKRLTEVFPGIETIEVNVMRTFDKDPTTSMDPAEVLNLCAILKHINAKTIVEVGTFDGNTTLNLADNSAADAKVYTMDLPENWNGKTEIRIPELYVNVTDRSTIGAQYKKHPEQAKKIIQVFGDSATLDWGALQSPFDLVFIDGCHHYSYVKSDTENALKHLRKGGIIAWHDYGMIEDVSRAVDEVKGIDKFVIRGTRLAIGIKN